MDEVKASLTRMLKAAKREIRQLGLRRRIFMGTNPERIPTRPAEPEQLDAETRRILADRMRTFEHDRKASGPADEVMERLLRRHPAP